MRAVFDTNVYISALIAPGSQAERAILKVLHQEETLLISREIIDEILMVLSGKFSRDREAISRVAVYLTELGKMVRPTGKIKILKDEPDNRILECAIHGKADVIVTGDKEILNLKEYQGIKIITLKDYLEA